MDDRDTDRELLEKAARAAGIKIIFEPNGQARNVTGMHPSMNLFSAPVWAPLTDHGDRYRLARDLKMMVDFEHGCVFRHGDELPSIRFTPGDDKSEAYAILRAAAAMGEN